MDIEYRISILYGFGLGIAKTSALLECSTHKVRKTLKKRGIDTRSSGGNRGRGHNFKGGRVVSSQDYIYIHKSVVADERMHSMCYSNGYVGEHRLVMATYLGRPLHQWEQVHHRDNDKANNSIGNLQLRIKAHGSGAAFRCADCGSFNLLPEDLS